MEVSTSALRADLATWLRRVASGDEVVVTDRGTPVARIMPVAAASTIERLLAEGIISRAQTPVRPTARGAVRAPSSAPDSTPDPTPVADLVSDQRR